MSIESIRLRFCGTGFHTKELRARRDARGLRYRDVKLSLESIRGHQLTHAQRCLGERDRAPARRGGHRSHELNWSRVRRRGPRIGACGGEPWGERGHEQRRHEQGHGQALRLVSDIAVVVAILPLRRDIAQIAPPQRPRTFNASRRLNGRPVIHQNEFHGAGQSLA